MFPSQWLTPYKLHSILRCCTPFYNIKFHFIPPVRVRHPQLVWGVGRPRHRSAFVIRVHHLGNVAEEVASVPALWWGKVVVPLALLASLRCEPRVRRRGGTGSRKGEASCVSADVDVLLCLFLLFAYFLQHRGQLQGKDKKAEAPPRTVPGKEEQVWKSLSKSMRGVGVGIKSASLVSQDAGADVT